MKLSKLIRDLEEARNRFGDIDIGIMDPTLSEEGLIKTIEPSISLEVNETNNIVGITLVDKETALGFD